MARRGTGIGHILANKNVNSKYAEFGNRNREQNKQKIMETLGSFQSKLEEFARKHRDEINSNPEFRDQFNVMCKEVGVDPLASNKGFWANLLGIGDYYYELGVLVIQITLQTRAVNGGIMGVDDVVTAIQNSKHNGKKGVSQEDVIRAVDKLAILGSGFRIIQLTTTSKPRLMLLSVPMELNLDHEILMKYAQDNGFVSARMLCDAKGWSNERFNIAVHPLLYEGMLWLDLHRDEKNFYFYSI